VAARPCTRHHHWRRVNSRAATRKNSSTGGWIDFFPLLFLAGSDLQNQPKTQHRQLILVVFLCCYFRSALGFFSQICPVLARGDNHRHLQKKKKTQAKFRFFLPFFRSALFLFSLFLPV